MILRIHVQYIVLILGPEKHINPHPLYGNENDFTSGLVNPFRWMESLYMNRHVIYTSSILYNSKNDIAMLLT